MKHPQQRSLELDRMLFFSDAVVAIAITLLALGLRLDVPEGHRIRFGDLVSPWRKYLAFILSFVNIAGFWQTHHTIFSYVNKMDRRMLVLNLCWLFFIIIVPFSTSIISDHFADGPAIFLYCMNVLFISLLQKFIWDYGDEEIAATASRETVKYIDVMFTVHLANGVIAVVFSFFMPLVGFVLLYLKIPIFIFGWLYSKRK
ncbi:MAG: DUF1211 domain-containing protein [Bacteroidetes bacterium]|nr:DUF1211 domain-containing protein [Bacteroidota bacterium]